MRHTPQVMCSLVLFTFSVCYLPNQPLIAATSQPSSTARPNPDAQGNYHVGDGVAAPKVIYAPEPEFTDEARQKGVFGTVSFWVLVKEDGTPKDVHVAKSLGEGRGPNDKEVAAILDKNALKAVEHYRFKPATFRGRPVAVEVQVDCMYKP